MLHRTNSTSETFVTAFILSFRATRSCLLFSNVQMSSDSSTSVPALVSAEEFMKHEYDYVICGGVKLAWSSRTRLAERQDVNVGVIEAGKSKIGDVAVDTPGMCLSLVGNPEYD